MPTFGLINPDYQMRLRRASGDANGPVYLLSLARFRAGSGQILGRGSRDDPDSQYVPIPLLTAVGGRLCLVADVVAGWGGWDRVGVMRFPTRQAIMTMNDHSDMTVWNAAKERRTERVIMLGLVPAAGPPVEPSQRILLEVWHGPAPPPMAAGPVTKFEVEGTFIGDGRRWSGARYTAIDPGTVLPLEPARFGYLALLVEPVIERWI